MAAAPGGPAGIGTASPTTATARVAGRPAGLPWSPTDLLDPPAPIRSAPPGNGRRFEWPGWASLVTNRQTGPVLLKDIRAVATETMVLSPEDPSAEDANTTWFGAPPHERMGLSADEVVAAFEETAACLRSHVAGLGHRGTATFYVWHDAVAGQLRCSAGTCKPSDLPFDAAYRLTDDLRGIVVEFLEDRAPGSIAWGELEPVPYPEDTDTPAVSVWAFDLTPFGR